MNIFEHWMGAESETFRSNRLGQRPHAFQELKERVESVRALRHNWSVSSLLEDQRDGVVAWFQDRRGRHRTSLVRPSEALGFYEAGITLYLKKAPWLESVRRDVGAFLQIPECFITTTTFCNQPGARTSVHFDPVDTLTIQVLGRKTWRYAPNHDVPSPTQSWVPGSEMDRELRLYAKSSLPDEMPPNAESFTLGPGGMLYVPRGYWHETESDQESVSLHIHLLSYTWAEAVLGALRPLLVRNEEWRKSAHSLWTDGKTSGWGPNEAIASLKDIVGKMTADDLLAGSVENAPSEMAIVRRPRSWVEVSDAHGSGDRVQVTFLIDEHGLERRTVVEVSRTFVEALRMIEASSRPVSLRDLLNAIPGLKETEGRKLVAALVDIGFGRWASVSD